MQLNTATHAAQEHVQTKASLLSRMAEARLLTDDLFRLLRPEAFYDRPITERHRLIFYLGHLEAFDWNLLRGRIVDAEAFHPEYDQLFAFGIDPLEDGLPADLPGDWPSLADVREYVKQVRCSLDEHLEKLDPSALYLWCGPDYSASTLLNVAIEHRLMHLETLAYLLHQLPYTRKLEARALTPAPSSDEHDGDSLHNKPGRISIPAGQVTLGLPQHMAEASEFGWDNEFEAHRVSVPAFEIDEYKVSNGEYLDFVNAGGYRKQNYWDESGWNWILKHGIQNPVFWKQVGTEWHYRGMFREFPLPLSWPVYVSHAEASAFARWAGKSLPSEAQWHRAAYGRADGGENPYPWGEQPPTKEFGYFDFLRWDPAPVNAFPEARSAFGLAGLLANGWEWTSTPFTPFQGFKAFPFYPGYSANFFDGKHYVLKGGSTRTAACMLRRSFRNWFQPHYQYVYAGFRCVNS